MSDINIIYWTGTGNTEKMAEAIKEGIDSHGKVSKISYVSNELVSAVESSDTIVLGCPSMGQEVLEESEMEPFMEEIEGKIGGKNIALFGSYDWGDGQWMRDWEDRIKSTGANLISNEGLIINNTPEKEDLEKCREFGKIIASI